MMSLQRHLPFLRYAFYADNLLVALLPGHKGAAHSVVSAITGFMNEIDLEVKASIFGRGRSFLTLGILVSIDEG